MKKYGEFFATGILIPVGVSAVARTEGAVGGRAAELGISKSMGLLSVAPTIQAGGLIIDELMRFERFGKKKRR